MSEKGSSSRSRSSIVDCHAIRDVSEEIKPSHVSVRSRSHFKLSLSISKQECQKRHVFLKEGGENDK